DDGKVERIAGICVVEDKIACTPDEVPVLCPQPGSGKSYCGGPDYAGQCAEACTPSYKASADPLELRMAQPFGQSADPGGHVLYDHDGNLIFADVSNELIRRITPEGAIEIVAGLEPVDGKTQPGTSPDGIPATESKINQPVDLALADD